MEERLSENVKKLTFKFDYKNDINRLSNDIMNDKVKSLKEMRKRTKKILHGCIKQKVYNEYRKEINKVARKIKKDGKAKDMKVAVRKAVFEIAKREGIDKECEKEIEKAFKEDIKEEGNFKNQLDRFFKQREIIKYPIPDGFIKRLNNPRFVEEFKRFLISGEKTYQAINIIWRHIQYESDFMFQLLSQMSDKLTCPTTFHIEIVYDERNDHKVEYFVNRRYKDWDKFVTSIKRCFEKKMTHQTYRFAYIFHVLYEKGEKVSHGNGIIIDRINKTIYHIEPQGIYLDNLMEHKKKEDFIKSILKKIFTDYEFVTMLEQLGICPTNITSEALRRVPELQTKRSLCQTYTLFLILTYVLNPEITQKGNIYARLVKIGEKNDHLDFYFFLFYLYKLFKMKLIKRGKRKKKYMYYND